MMALVSRRLGGVIMIGLAEALSVGWVGTVWLF